MFRRRFSGHASVVLLVTLGLGGLGASSEAMLPFSDEPSPGAADAGPGARWGLRAAIEVALGGNPGLPSLQGSVPPASHAPSEGLPPGAGATALLARHQLAVDPTTESSLAAWDALPPPVREALGGVFEAFLRLDEASVAAFQPERLSNGPAEAAPGAGMVRAARGEFLRAVATFHLALAANPVLRDLPDVHRCPALATDFAGTDTVYREDCALILDLGGNDAYANNAGGSSVRALDGRVPVEEDGGCAAGPSPRGLPGGAAAVVDLGAGSDVYGDPGRPRSCGANGGGHLGVGVLIDEGGDDQYTGGDGATNGGGFDGMGFLLDAAGHDRYVGGRGGVNGGAGGGLAWSDGVLFDADGSDHYEAWAEGVNGGVRGPGQGRLTDLRGDDRYVALDGGANGGVALGSVGSGCLQDATGYDIYWDLEGGAGVDLTVVPKGTLGAQIDRTDEQPTTPSGCEVADFGFG